MAGLPDTLACRKHRNEESPALSGDSTASKLPPLVINLGAQAKKRKLSGSSPRPDVSEPVDPELGTSEIPVDTPGADQHTHEETPPPTEPADADVIISETNPETDPKPPSPLPITQDMPAQEEEVTITGSAYTAPAPSNVLTKHINKNEMPSPEKEKTKLDLPSLEKLTADELHSGYLSRLATSRDMKARLVDMMKRKYDILHFLLSVYPLHSPQGSAYILEDKSGLEYLCRLQ